MTHPGRIIGDMWDRGRRAYSTAEALSVWKMTTIIDIRSTRTGPRTLTPCAETLKADMRRSALLLPSRQLLSVCRSKDSGRTVSDGIHTSQSALSDGFATLLVDCVRAPKPIDPLDPNNERRYDACQAHYWLLQCYASILVQAYTASK